MAPRKLIPKLKQFLAALGDRYQRALLVIDEALASESLKDKIWAVDLILKRLPNAAEDEKAAKSQPADAELNLDSLSDADLLQSIRQLLHPETPL